MISDTELARLQIESNKPFICPQVTCPEYMTRPICNNHAHVKCDMFGMTTEEVENDFLRRYRAVDGNYNT